MKPIILYFAKTRIADKELELIELYRNYNRCNFDVIGDVVMEGV